LIDINYVTITLHYCMVKECNLVVYTPNMVTYPNRCTHKCSNHFCIQQRLDCFCFQRHDPISVRHKHSVSVNHALY